MGSDIKIGRRGGAMSPWHKQTHKMIHLFFLSLMCREAEGDVPRCSNEDIGNRPFCFPSNYNKDLIPPLAENRSLHVHVETYIFEVSRIDDMALTMTFELYMDFMWEETRILINNNSTGWGHAGHFMASTNYLAEMWLQDTQIYMCKQFLKRQIVTDVAGLIIFKNKQ